jgi:putative CocE/NonD family hydrolase
MAVPRLFPSLATLALITTTSLMTAGAVPAAATPVATRTGAGVSTSLPLKSKQARVAAVEPGVTHDQNPLVPVGASWTEHYFSSPQAGSPTKVELHADVLRPTTVARNAQTPVIVSVGPYFSHAGQTGPETTATGPSQRFADLIEGARLMDRGYTVVLVDLRGYGGSTGCLDWNGPGEQADIKRSVEWAAAQKWSNGKVGTYGKSYDAQTGLWANNLRPKGLEAVVAQEPLWNGYNYYYSNGVARPNNVYTPDAYNSIAQIPGTPGDSARYKANAAYETTHPECLSANSTAGIDNTSPDDEYWRDRDNVGRAKGTTTPLFFTQGFTESNTKPEQMEEFLANHKGPERGWLGPWEHVRGNEVDPATGRLLMGRAGFFSEVVRFYDKHLKGKRPSVKDPNFAIQGSDGKWRAQRTWPGRATPSTVSLKKGTYVDSGALPTSKVSAAQQKVQSSGGDMDRQVSSRLLRQQGQRSASNSPALAAATASTYLTFSKPVARTTRLTATPRIQLQTKGRGDVMVRLWDVTSATKKAVLINENVARLTGRETTFDLKSMDWKLAAGHRLAVSIGTIDPSGYWSPQPSGTTVKVQGAFLSLDTQSPRRDVSTQGEKSAFLDGYIANNTVALAAVPAGTFTVKAPKK